MVYTRLIQCLLIGFSLILTMGCQQGSSTMDDRGTTALVQDANGKSYDVSCLKNGSPQTMSACEVSPGTQGPSKNSRGIYYSNPSYNYYYWNLFGFNQGDFCSYLWGMSNCYYYFGYNSVPNYYYGGNSYCSSSYLNSSYYYYPVPAYCYWNYGSTVNESSVRLKLKITPVAGVTTEPASKTIYLDGSGRVLKKVCTTSSTSSCTSTIVEYLTPEMRSTIEGYITQARSGQTVQLDTSGTINCLAMATTTDSYTADNGTVFLRSGNAPCGSETVFYNNSSAAQTLVQKLDSWRAY